MLRETNPLKKRITPTTYLQYQTLEQRNTNSLQKGGRFQVVRKSCRFLNNLIETTFNN